MRRETALKIVNLLRKELDKGFTIREISKRLKIGYVPAHNHISEMISERIIKAQKVGRAKQCFLNIENVKCRQLLMETDAINKEEILKKNNKLKPVLESLITKISETSISSIHSIILFGSYAKGTATKSSDIDVLFIICDIKDKATRENIERECSSYQYSHNIKISPLITDIPELKKMLGDKNMNVGKETREHGIPLYGSEIFWRLMT